VSRRAPRERYAAFLRGRAEGPGGHLDFCCSPQGELIASDAGRLVVEGASAAARARTWARATWVLRT
jgi:hypothetical protein